MCPQNVPPQKAVSAWGDQSPEWMAASLPGPRLIANPPPPPRSPKARRQGTGTPPQTIRKRGVEPLGLVSWREPPTRDPSLPCSLARPPQTPTLSAPPGGSRWGRGLLFPVPPPSPPWAPCSHPNPATAAPSPGRGLWGPDEEAKAALWKVTLFGRPSPWVKGPSSN